ncbi:MAG: hypothetical protein QOF53_1532 [Nocardioidaceae bacterium]|jgi:hypothetical protein|nr:hypothetical protein [Nocardioidaceae bacterium]
MDTGKLARGRDDRLAVARGLRLAVVAAGVAGSMGVAALIALASPGTAASSSTPGGPGPGPQQRGDRSDDHDSFSQRQNDVPDLEPGSGPVDGSTGGS